MFLKEPEKNCQLINNNGNFQGGLQSKHNDDISGDAQINAIEESQTEHNVNTDDQGNKGYFESGDKVDDFIEKIVTCDIRDCKKAIPNISIASNNTEYLNSGDHICNQQFYGKENKTSDDNDNDLSDTEVKVEKGEYKQEDIIFDYDESERSYSSSADVTPLDVCDYDYEVSDSDDSCIQDVNEIRVLPRGIHNPNYPGFQHLAYTLQDYSPQISEAYENTLFSNVYIQCKDEEELLKLTLADQRHVIETKSIATANIKEYDYSDDDEGISTKFMDLDDSEYMRDISSDSAIFDNRETDFSQDDTFLHSSSISTIDDFNTSISGEFQDELTALRHEIYDIIQKPLASTIDSVSEVINTVIRHIVEYQTKYEVDVWNTLSQEAIQGLAENLQIQTELDDINGIFNNGYENITEKENTDLNHESSNKIVMEAARNTVDSYVTNIADAYITNVTEELFKSPDFEKHICNETYSISDENMTETNKTDCSTNASASDKNLKSFKSQKSASDKNDSNQNSYENKQLVSRRVKRENKESIPTRKLLSKKSEQNSKQKSSSQETGGFDVYNIETAMPVIDLDVIENHLKAAREDERWTRNDREEIRRRLALGSEVDEFYRFGDRPGKKPSLQTRLQSGMNLQICFMNETASDTESLSDGEGDEDLNKKTNHIEDKCQRVFNMSLSNTSKSKHITTNKELSNKGAIRPSTLALNDMARPTISSNPTTQAAFFECQARLQTEARMALAQAKELAHVQMEIERNKQEISPITEMLRNSLHKAGVKLTGDRRRVSRQMLTDMNVAQLQVIVNELHTQIEFLNETLVKLLIARDELHMGQDSMLVDIEDLTRYLSAKELSLKMTGSDSPCYDKDKYYLKSHIISLSSLLNK